MYKKLKCGCEIPIVNGKIHIDYDNLNDQCPKTWELYLNGHTRSIFQLESRLCKSWARELIPSSMKDAADLIAIVRPGTLNSTDENGKSMTKIFCDRKTGKEEFTPASLYEKLLADTYSIIVYQEQLLFIAKQIAGFDGKMANKLMKGVGKKNAELLFSLEKAFLEGCNNTNAVSQDEAKKIFENIKASARYCFNKSLSSESITTCHDGSSKTIAEIQKGDIIKTPNGYAEVVDKYDHGVLDTYEITLSNGSSIKCTLNHKFLCDNGEILPLWQILSENREIIVE